MFHGRVCAWLVLVGIAFGLAGVNAEAGLVAAYGHENPANRLQDDTGNGHALTNVNTVTFVDSPANSNFYYFDAGDTVARYSSSAHLQVPNSAYSGGSFTFTGLVNKGTGGGFQTILSSSRFRLQRAINTDWNSGNPVLNLSVVTGSTNNTWVACDFREAEWYFLALCYDSSANTLKASIQGASSNWAPTTVSVSTPAAFTDLTNMTLGRNVSSIGGADNWNGMIDSARFYNTALTDTQLEAVFFQFLVPEPSALMLLMLGLCGLLLRRSRRRGS